MAHINTSVESIFFLQRSHLFLSDHTSGETRPSPLSSCLQHPRLSVRGSHRACCLECDLITATLKEGVGQTECDTDSTECQRPHALLSQHRHHVDSSGHSLCSFCFFIFRAGMKWQLCGRTTMWPKSGYQALLVVYLEIMSQPSFYQGQKEVVLYCFGEEIQMS